MDDEQIDRALAAFDLALRHVRASIHAGKVYGMDPHLDLWMVRLAVATEGVKAIVPAERFPISRAA